MMMNRRAVMKGVASLIPKRSATAQIGGNNTRIADMGPRVENPQQLNQDVPPPGGFPAVRVRRNAPNKFWSIGTFLFITTAVMSYGWYRYYKWLKKKDELKKEREVLELAMTPFLQAEHDIAFTLQRRAFLKKVEELMKNEPDFNAYEKFYNSSSRFLYPVYIAQLRHLTGTGVLEKEKQFYDKAKQPAQQ
ncbi:hypothetical protein FDP41_007694 [Naegleria fowleri]|uniref:NADH dehydrogenase [ubiquinone] 1 alpha subcomplex subunit 13 n=1 Tax=Naegleria fowleri TaxID=5763 RepID=A0A6A5CEN5_NAEFO|nr:uncharacterized protein FDP41_007694 [Naegleria fowleri]KAF0983779.1 hypothetical protein FDP41_007694 [Naegleria fowleri]